MVLYVKFHSKIKSNSSAFQNPVSSLIEDKGESGSFNVNGYFFPPLVYFSSGMGIVKISFERSLVKVGNKEMFFAIGTIRILRRA